MNIYTSYFANWRKFPKDVHKYSVARELKWETDMEKLLLFAPSKELLHKFKCELIDEEAFTEQYIKQLENSDLTETVTQLIENEASEDIVLLCYEKKGEFCHRHILSKYLNEKYGAGIKEL